MTNDFQMKRIAVVLNEQSGTVVRLGRESVVELIKDALAAAGVEHTIEAVPGSQVEELLREAFKSDADVVWVGGGDGTVATAATLASQSNKLLGILPLGTFNLAARDMNVPLELEEAVAALLAAPEKAVDALELNGRLYLCLMVFGFYPALKMAEPEHHGWWIVRAAKSLIRAFRRAATYPSLDLTFEHEGKSTRCLTRMVLLANNDYEDVSGIIPIRRQLDGGFFTLYVSRHTTRWGMMRSVLAWVLGRWTQDHELTHLRTTEVTIHVKRRRRVPVMMDGETQKLPSPIRVRHFAGAVRMLVPADREAESQ